MTYKEFKNELEKLVVKYASENEAELRININVIKNECYIGDIASSVEYETNIVTKIG